MSRDSDEKWRPVKEKPACGVQKASRMLRLCVRARGMRLMVDDMCMSRWLLGA